MIEHMALRGIKQETIDMIHVFCGMILEHGWMDLRIRRNLVKGTVQAIMGASMYTERYYSEDLLLF